VSFNPTEGYSSERSGKLLDIDKTITKTLRHLSIGRDQKESTLRPSACRAHYGVGKKGLKTRRRKSDDDKPLETDKGNDDDFDQPSQHSSYGHNAAITTNQGTVSRETAEKRDR
jgi:hypothetical protein